MLNAVGTVPFSGLIAAYKPSPPAASQMYVSDLNAQAVPASKTFTASITAFKVGDRVEITSTKAMPLMTADSTQCRREMGYLTTTEQAKYFRDLCKSKANKGIARMVREGYRMANFYQSGSAFAEAAAGALERQNEDTQFNINLVPLTPPALRLINSKPFDYVI